MKDLTKDNWYYVQAFGDTKNGELLAMYTIVFAENLAQAKERVQIWLVENNLTRGVHYYHKNYKREAKRLLAENNYLIK